MKTLDRLPVGIGVCTDADEAGDENGESGYGDEQKVVHTCLLFALANAALNPSGVVLVVISAGGGEVLTQPSRSLAYFAGARLPAPDLFRSRPANSYMYPYEQDVPGVPHDSQKSHKLAIIAHGS